MATALDKSHTTSWANMAVQAQQIQDNLGNAVDVVDVRSVADPGSRVVSATASSLAVTAALHAGRTILLNRAAGVAVTLPAATGTGNVYTIRQGTTLLTSASHTITAASTADLYYGVAHIDSTTKTDSNAFPANASSNYICTFAFASTIAQGFAYPGDTAVFVDVGTNAWLVKIHATTAATTPATPFSG